MYTIRHLRYDELYQLSEFVVMQNYLHHAKDKSDLLSLEQEILHVYEEEKRYFPFSEFYVAQNDLSEMIGSIRVMRWHKDMVLPLQRIFNLQLETCLPVPEPHVWHIGRFAVSGKEQGADFLLFKKLIALSIRPVYEDSNSYMVAELDNKLFHTFSLLGITAHPLSQPVEYLGSPTLAVYSSKADLTPFYEKYESCITMYSRRNPE